jgi:hypothetical protein
VFIMRTYWALVTGSAGQYSFSYYPALKAQPNPANPCAGEDALPLAPNFAAAPIEDMPSGPNAVNIRICQVNQAPEGQPAVAAELQLLGVVAKTLEGSLSLPNWASVGQVEVCASQGRQTRAVQVQGAWQQPPQGQTITRGMSLAFQRLDPSGRAQDIICSPDPASRVPGSNQ